MKILFITHTDDPTTGGWGRYAYDLKQALRAQGYSVNTLSDVGKISPVNPIKFLHAPIGYLRAYNLIRRAILTFEPDIIHITVEPYVLLVPFFPKSKAKIFLTVHGTYAFLPTHVALWWRYIARVVFRYALRRISRIISVSEYTKTQLLKGIAHSHISINFSDIITINNGVAITQYIFRDVSENKDKMKYILTVAPVKHRKGILEAVRALGEYRKRHGEEFVYRIVGSYDKHSSYARILDAEIRILGLEKKVVFLGRLSEEALQEEYARADLFLMLPVHVSNRFEGFGLVYLEANAYGVPAIGSKNAGSAEAIKNGVSGYSVDPVNVSEVAEKIHSILSRNAISRHECRVWAEKHAIEKIAKEYALLYSRAVELNNDKH